MDHMSLTPPEWTRTLAETGSRPISFGSVRRDANGNLPTCPIDTPRSPEWIAARTKFVEQWQTMTEQGLAEGFLEQTACYECPGVIEPTTDTLERRYDPNPDYVAPVVPDTFRIPRA